MRKRVLSICKLLSAILMLVCLIGPVLASVEPTEISTQELKNKLDSGDDLVLVNVMPRIIHDSKHIKGSINIAIGKIKTSTELPTEKDKLIVFYCMGPQWLYSPKAARLAVEMGYTNVMVYKKGIPGWAKAGNPLVSNVKYPKVKTPTISAQELSSQESSSFFILDIRPVTNFQKGHVKGSTNIDLEDLHEKFSSIPRGKKVVLVDHKGKITNITGQFLAYKDYENVVRLDGGFNAWAKKGMPIEK